MYILTRDLSLTMNQSDYSTVAGEQIKPVLVGMPHGHGQVERSNRGIKLYYVSLEMLVQAIGMITFLT